MLDTKEWYKELEEWLDKNAENEEREETDPDSIKKKLGSISENTEL